MPQDAQIPPAETEKGFGTGLRAQLSRRRWDADLAELDLAASPDAEETASEDDGAADAESVPAAPPDPEALASELEAALDREQALKTALTEQTDAYERALEELEERERRAIEAMRAAEEKEQALEAAAASDAVAEGGSPRNGETARTYLRRRLEQNGERVWNAFEAALESTRADGTPDYRTRLAAATALLAEAYAPTDGSSALELEGEPGRDDLAMLRAARALKPLS